MNLSSESISNEVTYRSTMVQAIKYPITTDGTMKKVEKPQNSKDRDFSRIKIFSIPEKESDEYFQKSLKKNFKRSAS